MHVRQPASAKELTTTQWPNLQFTMVVPACPPLNDFLVVNSDESRHNLDSIDKNVDKSFPWISPMANFLLRVPLHRSHYITKNFPCLRQRRLAFPTPGAPSPSTRGKRVLFEVREGDR